MSKLPFLNIADIRSMTQSVDLRHIFALVAAVLVYLATRSFISGEILIPAIGLFITIAGRLSYRSIFSIAIYGLIIMIIINILFSSNEDLLPIAANISNVVLLCLFLGTTKIIHDERFMKSTDSTIETSTKSDLYLQRPELRKIASLPVTQQKQQDKPQKDTPKAVDENVEQRLKYQRQQRPKHKVISSSKLISPPSKPKARPLVGNDISRPKPTHPSSPAATKAKGAKNPTKR